MSEYVHIYKSNLKTAFTNELKKYLSCYKCAWLVEGSVSLSPLPDCRRTEDIHQSPQLLMTLGHSVPPAGYQAHSNDSKLFNPVKRANSSKTLQSSLIANHREHLIRVLVT